jgi:hypothetical protein
MKPAIGLIALCSGTAGILRFVYFFVRGVWQWVMT